MLSKKHFVVALATGVVAMALGCGVEPEDETDLEIVENLRLAGHPAAEIEVRDDGTVIVGGDAVVSLAASREMIGLGTEDEHDEELGFRQYRTTNRVSPALVDTICIDGSDLTGTVSTALNAAIANYTNMKLAFNMVRTTGAAAGCDALITANLVDGTSAEAGFPAGGLPYDTIDIGDDIAPLYGLDAATHVITHELGHCIGFRHSDYFDRSISCGGVPDDEGVLGIGAVHIAGTPADAEYDGSIMNSCYNLGSTGEWTDTDITALNALYLGPPAPNTLVALPNQCYGFYDIDWGTSVGATSYQLYGSTSSSFTSPFLLHSGAGTDEAINVSTGTWYLRARACDATNCGPWTRQVSATRLNVCL